MRPRARQPCGIILTPGLHRVGLGIAGGTFDGPGAVLATADFAAERPGRLAGCSPAR